MRQPSSPLLALNAEMYPRIGPSPPPVPRMTLSFTTVGLRGGDFGLPAQRTCLRVERDEVGVQRAHVNGVAQDRYAAVKSTTAGARLWRRRVVEGPVRSSGHRVQRDHIVRLFYGVQDPVEHYRSRLELLERPRLPDPRLLQALHIGRVDLRERAEALILERAGVGQPVVRLFVHTAQDAIEGDLRLQRRRGKEDDEDKSELHIQPLSRNAVKTFRQTSVRGQ